MMITMIIRVTLIMMMTTLLINLNLQFQNVRKCGYLVDIDVHMKITIYWVRVDYITNFHIYSYHHNLLSNKITFYMIRIHKFNYDYNILTNGLKKNYSSK